MKVTAPQQLPLEYPDRIRPAPQELQTTISEAGRASSLIRHPQTYIATVITRVMPHSIHRTRTLSNDLGPDNITMNMVSGGLLRTTDASAATPEAVFDMIAQSTPLRRVTTPAEFADATLFFASPWARSVTGQNLIVDCGLVKN